MFVSEETRRGHPAAARVRTTGYRCSASDNTVLVSHQPSSLIFIFALNKEYVTSETSH